MMSSSPALPFHRLSRMIVGALLVSSLLTVACGGGDDDADGGQDPTATVAAASTPTVAATSTATPEPPTATTAPATATTAPATPTTGSEASTPTADGPSIRVSGGGPIDRNYLVITSGLEPDVPYTMVIRYPDGEEEAYLAEYDPDSMELIGSEAPYRGQPLSVWEREPNDPTGEYTIEIQDEDGEVIASTTFIAE